MYDTATAFEVIFRYEQKLDTLYLVTTRNYPGERDLVVAIKEHVNDNEFSEGNVEIRFVANKGPVYYTKET